jgi:hypothetical protein
MQCEYLLIDRQCPRVATHVHRIKSYRESKTYAYPLQHAEATVNTAYVCSDHSFAEDKSIHEVASERVSGGLAGSTGVPLETQAQKDAIRVIEASSKPNRSYAEGAARPTAVWYHVVRYAKPYHASDAFVLAKFRYESDALAFADLQRSKPTDYAYTIKAGR